MIPWIQNHPADFAVILLLALSVLLAILLIRKDRRTGKSSCGGNCADCVTRGSCGYQKNSSTDNTGT